MSSLKLKITGQIMWMGDIRQGQGPRGTWSSRDLALMAENGQYPQPLKIVFKKGCEALQNFQYGQIVDITVALSGNEYQNNKTGKNDIWVNLVGFDINLSNQNSFGASPQQNNQQQNSQWQPPWPQQNNQQQQQQQQQQPFNNDPRQNQQNNYQQPQGQQQQPRSPSQQQQGTEAPNNSFEAPNELPENLPHIPF